MLDTGKHILRALRGQRGSPNARQPNSILTGNTIRRYSSLSAHEIYVSSGCLALQTKLRILSFSSVPLPGFASHESSGARVFLAVIFADAAARQRITPDHDIIR